jgi:hypothetical protein
MANCDKHPGRKADTYTSIGYYCKQCAEQIKKVQSEVDSYVEPRECFFEYKGTQKGWGLFVGTPCAHYVAHQHHIKRGHAGEICALGFSIRVPDVISGARRIEKREDVQLRDVWANDAKDHCGLVSKIEGEGEKKKIKITHCSSGQRLLATDDFDTKFGGKGKFYRW